MSKTPSKPSRIQVHFAAPDRLIWVAAVGVVLWAVWAFSSELMLNLRLHHQVEKLRAQNAQLADANAQARHELEAVGSLAAIEQRAREQGLARKGENVYLIASPSVPPGAGGSPGVTAGGPAAEQKSQERGSVWESVVNWWRKLWH